MGTEEALYKVGYQQMHVSLKKIRPQEKKTTRKEGRKNRGPNNRGKEWGEVGKSVRNTANCHVR